MDQRLMAFKEQGRIKRKETMRSSTRHRRQGFLRGIMTGLFISLGFYCFKTGSWVYVLISAVVVGFLSWAAWGEE
jgi:hypothetical protein